MKNVTLQPARSAVESYWPTAKPCAGTRNAQTRCVEVANGDGLEDGVAIQCMTFIGFWHTVLRRLIDTWL